jgi:hypothetical protein
MESEPCGGASKLWQAIKPTIALGVPQLKPVQDYHEGNGATVYNDLATGKSH